MTIRVWLHEGHDGGAGVEAWALDFLGFSTWARTREEVLAKLPGKLAEHCAWRERHGLRAALPGSHVEIAGHVTGNEVLFPPDLEPATGEEIELAIGLLGCSREDLVADLEAAPPAALDWDPPYASFAAWADWRTIRANLAHIASAETHYYARNLGHVPRAASPDPRGDWREFLPRTRAECIQFLRVLASSSDLARVSSQSLGSETEHWSLRKALRRLVSHELVHWKSIRRILRSYRP